MDRCTHYQSQMLDYVYDLLDAEVVQALTLHLAHCPDCQAALRAARGQQQLLAAAARLEFPGVCFRLPETPVEVPETVPAEDEPAPEPVILPARPTIPLTPTAPAVGEGPKKRARPRRLAWQGWLSAAAVLLALMVPAALRWDYLGARRDLDRYDTAHVEARREHAAVTERLVRLDRDEEQKAEGLDQEVRQKERHVTVIGPRTLQSGTPNDYQIVTHDGQDALVASRLTVSVHDKESNKLLYKVEDQESEGLYHLTLPSKLDVGPNSRVMLEVVAADANGSKTKLREDFRLTAPLYLTHLTTDKPVYQPGEMVRFRSLTLERFSLTPAREPLALHFTLSTPGGGVIEAPPTDRGNAPDVLALKTAIPFRFGWGWGRVGGEGKAANEALRGIAAGEWEVPAGCPPGEYTLTVSEEQNRFPPQQRKFLVHHFEKPSLVKELDFPRPGYRPGEEVVAICRARQADGTPLADRPVTATVKVDGKTYGVDGRAGGALRLSTDAEGKVHVRFRLPERIEKGRASVEVAFHDGKHSESVFRAIPVVPKQLDVEFYPEGGYLVPGGPNRVYFRARTPAGRPVELTGRLFDDLGDEVAQVETFHDKAPGANQGTGSFRLTPHRGRTYSLKVDSPAGAEVRNTLTTNELGKVALTVLSPVTTAHEPIEVRVRSAGADRKLLVAAYCRGRLFDHKLVDAKAEQETAVQLKPAHGIGGVYRVTVFEELESDAPQTQLAPRAERLVFRRHRDRLNLSIAADKDFYVPGEQATLTVASRGEDQESIPAVTMLSVVDRAALSLADEKTARSMPAHFYLASQLQNPDDLEHADFLLTPNSTAERALDLLLGTQGWRRFVERGPGELLDDRSEATVLALGEAVEVPRVARENRREEQALRDSKVTLARKELHERFQAKREQLLGRQTELDESLSEARLSPAYQGARAKVASYESLVLAIRALFPLVGLFLVIAAAVLLGRGLARPASRAVPHFSAAVGCAALVLILGVVAFSGQRERDGASIEEQQASAPPKKPEELERLGKGKEAARAPLKQGEKRDSARDDPHSGGFVPTSGSTGDNETPKNDMKLDGKPIEEQKLPKVLPEYGKPGTGDDQLPPPSPPQTAPVGQLPGGGGHGIVGQSGGAKLPPVEQVAPGTSPGGYGLAGGYAGPMGGGTSPPNYQSSTTTPAPGADKYRGGGGPGGSTYTDEVEQERTERMKRLTTSAGKDRNAVKAKGRPQAKRATAQRLENGAAHFFAREYRHQGKELEELSPDFTDTVCWQPALILWEGERKVNFNLNDAVTSYQVTVFGHTADGRVAAATRTLEARKPLSLRPLIPSEVTEGDRIDVPVQVLNRTGKEQAVDLDFPPADGKQAPPPPSKPATTDDPGKAISRLRVPPGKVQRFMYPLVPEVSQGEARLQVEGRTENLGAETVRSHIRVVPQGFPVTGSHSGLLEGKDEHTILLPREWVKGTLDCRIEVFPSPLADLQKGLDALLRQPGRNFEQAATTSYSNVLLLDQLKESKESRPELEKKSRELLESTYRTMTTYECVDPVRQVPRGFEWFGGTAPPHDALTAYGLMQLRDVARFQEVDRALLERTRKYLLASGDSKGGVRREQKTASNLGARPAPVSDAYVVWALTESGNEDNVTRALNSLAQRAKTSKDPYLLALVANSLTSRKRAGEAVPLLRKVVAAQKDDGHLDAEQTSVTGSRGRDLQIETTALAVLGWQRADATQFRAPVEKAVRWLAQQRDGSGAFGSTQATVLALKALVAQSRGASRAVEDGEVAVSVGGQRVARLSFKAGASAPLVVALPEPEKFLKPGANSVRIELTGKNRLPATLSWSYRSLEPAHDEACPVRLNTSLDRSQATEGQRVRLTVQLENRSDQEQGVVVAVVGLPAGLSLAKDGERPRVGSFEVRGRELVLSWRGLAPHQKIEVPIDLVCRVPGEYRGPTSRAYPQYDADHKTWAAPLQMRIAPMK